MRYVERTAPDGLTAAITRIWFLETTPAQPYEKILPMPFAHLIVNLSAPYRLSEGDGGWSPVPMAFVSGLQSEYLVIASPARIRHVGVEFTPTGLSAVTRDVAGAAGRVRDAGSIVPGMSAFAERVRGDDDPERALDALEAQLSAILHHRVDPLVEAAVALIDGNTERAIGDIAAHLGVSHDALVERFRQATGTTPKRHARVVRFHRLIDAAHASGGSPNWAELAVTSGYYDQPHVIREFRRFSGWTPAEYFRLVAEHGPDAAHFVPLGAVPPHASS